MFIQERNNILTISPNLMDFYGNMMYVRDSRGAFQHKAMQLSKAKKRAKKVMAGLLKHTCNGQEPIFYCTGQELEVVNLKESNFEVKMNPKALGIQQPEDFEGRHIKIVFVDGEVKWSRPVPTESSVYQGQGFFILDSILVVASNVPGYYLTAATLATQRQIESIRDLVKNELEAAVEIPKPTQKVWSNPYYFVILDQTHCVEWKKIYMAAANCPAGWYFAMGRNTLMILGKEGEVYAMMATSTWDTSGIHAGMETEMVKWPKGNGNIQGDLSC